MEDNGVHSDDREPSRSIRHSVNPDPSKSPHSSRRSPDASSYSRSRESRSSLHHQQQNNRDRSRDRHRHNPSGKTRMSSAHSDDLIPRFREKQSRTLDSEPRSSRHGRTRSRSRSRDRGRHSRSPSLTRRNRSRSKSPHRKRSRRDRSPSRRSRDRDFHSTSKRRRHSPDSKKSTSHRKQSDSRSSPDPHNSSNRRSRRDSQARSPPRSARDSHRDSRDSRKAHRVERTRRSRSRSPTSDDWKSIPNRRRSALSEAFPSDTLKTTLLSADVRKERQTSRHRIPELSSESSARGISSRTGPDERTSSRHSRLDPNRSRNGRSKSPHYINSASPSQESRGVQDNYQETPTGPSSSHTHRSPPFDPPSGPSNKGIRSGFRGGAFSGRGSYHGSFGGQWTSNSSYGQSSFEQRQSNGNENDGTTAMDIDSNVPDERSFERTRDDRARDRTERPRYDAPTGPSVGFSSSLSGSKFSFAFKPSSKSGPAGPKPEISQKFNAFPSRRSVLQRDPENEPQPDAPTQPAALLDRRPPDGPRMAPKMRKVIKKMKRPKPRPTLTPDLVMSDSVFFRKPGNESVVGSGTYGKVFKGLNVYTKDQVALKRIRMEGEKDGFPVTAVREIKLLQSLRHRNIVNLQEVMVEKNDCFMVFEYLSHDLTGLLCHPNFRLGLPQKKHLAKQMFEGLDYLHVRGVLHRDIKAANILVSSDGILKIADFGLARFYAKRHQLEYTNRVITIWYRSPELLLGETKYTAAVDIWSAACVMMEIFGKKPIFPGDGTELSQLDKIYNVLGTPNRQDWPGLVDMPWFELLRPSAKRACTFYEVYRRELTPAAFELMQSMFLYDPTKRPSASEVLAHAYFTAEEPAARQAELTDIGGDWHEFESRALRKENERREREARRAAKNPAGHGVTVSGSVTNHDARRRSRGADGDEVSGHVAVDEKTAAAAATTTTTTATAIA